VRTSDGSYLIKPYSTGIVETTFVPKGETVDPSSHAVVLAPADVKTTLKQKGGSYEYATSGIVVTITKAPFRSPTPTRASRWWRKSAATST
jgi:hypothetical protein